MLARVAAQARVRARTWTRPTSLGSLAPCEPGGGTKGPKGERQLSKQRPARNRSGRSGSGGSASGRSGGPLVDEDARAEACGRAEPEGRVRSSSGRAKRAASRMQRGFASSTLLARRAGQWDELSVRGYAAVRASTFEARALRFSDFPSFGGSRTVRRAKKLLELQRKRRASSKSEQRETSTASAVADLEPRLDVETAGTAVSEAEPQACEQSLDGGPQTAVRN